MKSSKLICINIRIQTFNMSDIFVNTTVFSDKERAQNWFGVPHQIEDIDSIYQPWAFEESMIIMGKSHTEHHDNLLFNKLADVSYYQKNKQVQRKPSEELWSLCDLTSQDEHMERIQNYFNYDINRKCEIKDHQKSNKSGDGLDHNNSKFSMEHSINQFNSADCAEKQVYIEPKVRLCINRKDVVIKRYDLILTQLIRFSYILHVCWQFLYTPFLFIATKRNLSSILRSMRKYYSKLIEDMTKFNRKLRNIKLKQSLLIDSSEMLVSKIKFCYITTSLPFYLSAIAFPNDVKKLLKKACRLNNEDKSNYKMLIDEVNNIDKIFTRYSKKTLSEFLSKPEYSALLLYYLDKIQNKEYKDNWQILKDIATNSIENWRSLNASNGSNSTSFDWWYSGIMKRL